MGRLTEVWAVDKPGNKRDYAYTTPAELLKEKMSDDQEHSRYTPQQIRDFCEKIDNMHLNSRPEGEMLFCAVEMIRQVQNGG